MSEESQAREGILYRLGYAGAVTVPWLIAIYAGFNCYIYITYPHPSLDRLGPVLAMLFVLVVAAPIGVALGSLPQIRKPMGISGLVAAALLGFAACVGHLVLRWH